MKKYIRNASSAKTPSIKSATADYTGGGVYIFLGEFTDGTYFIADYPYWDLRVVDEDPRPTFWDDDAETSSGFPEWQEAHLVRDVDNRTTKAFYADLFDWIMKNSPDSNYNSGDIAELIQRNNRRR